MREPAALGVKVVETLEIASFARVVAQVPPMVKSPAFVPVVEQAMPVSPEPVVFERVSCAGLSELASPTVCEL